MATKIIKAWINGSIQEIEVEEMTSPEQGLSYEDRLIELEDKPIIADGNFLVGNGTTDLEEMTPKEVLSHIDGASVTTMTTAEFNAIPEEEINANTLYMLTDDEELYVTPQMFGAKGDGVTDDTESFKECLASGYDIFLPKGTYLISDTLNISERVRVVGCTGAGIYFVGNTLFETSTYFNAPFELSNVRITANGNKVLSVTNRGWGASVVLNDIHISEADDSCIEISGGFNVSMKRIIISARRTATGTILRLGTSTDTTYSFSNMIYLESCVFIANKNTNLMECGNSHNVHALNCTFEGFNVAVSGKAVLVGCWFENGRRAVFANENATLVSPNFAYVDIWSAPDDSNADIYTDVKKIQKAIYWLPKQSVLESMFRKPVEQMETLFAGGYVNGVYCENLVYSINSDLAYYNVPINKIWAKSPSSVLRFDLSAFREQTIGVFELKLYYFKVQDEAIVQRSFLHGVVMDGNLIVFDTVETPENSASLFHYDATNAYLSYGNDEGGSSMGWVELNRLGLNDDPSTDDGADDNLFDYGKSSSDYVLADTGLEPSMKVDPSVPALRMWGTTSGDSAVVRSEMYVASNGTYRLRATFTTDVETDVIPRFLLRCYNEAGEKITAAIEGWNYLAYYTGHYADVDDITFTLPEGTTQFQIGFVFKANPAATVTISDIELTVTEAST